MPSAHHQDLSEMRLTAFQREIEKMIQPSWVK